MTDLKSLITERETIKSDAPLDDNTVFWGIFIGIVIGFFGIIPRLPRRGQATRNRLINRSRKLLNQVDVDSSVADSLSVGREVARRRRAGE